MVDVEWDEDDTDTEEDTEEGHGGGSGCGRREYVEHSALRTAAVGAEVRGEGRSR